MDTVFTQRVKKGMEHERNREAPAERFPQFPEIPGGCFVDSDFLELEMTSIWKGFWLYACHTLA